MNPTNKIKLFLVDDDALFLKSLEIEFLDHADFEIETYSTGELCLANLSHGPDVIILDYHLDGIDKNAINGMETLDKIKAFNPEIAVIMLSYQDKIDVAIDSMKYGAYDYVVKGETAFSRIENVINNVSELHKVKTINNAYKKTIIFLSVVIGLIVLLALYLTFFTSAFSHMSSAS